MSVRGLLALVFVMAAVAAPVPKSLKKPPDKFDTARFNVRYNKAPFDTVLKHFADETGLEWVGDRPELRTVTMNPRREFTAADYLDLLNELLEQDNFIALRHGKTFYLHPFSLPIDVEKVDTVSAEEIIQPKLPPVEREDWVWRDGEFVRMTVGEPAKLPPSKRGKTEVVTAVIPLTTLAYDDIRPQVKKSLSPFGRVEAGEDEKSIRVTDRVDNLRFIERLVNDSGKSNCGFK